LTPQPGEPHSFLQSLNGLDVCFGRRRSARAVAFHISDHLDNGALLISNRTSAALKPSRRRSASWAVTS
jgi:hypothetical protein